MVKRFCTYSKKAIENYKGRCAKLKKGIEVAERSGDMVSAKKYKRLLFKQRAILAALFAYSFCCLIIILFGF